MLFLWAIVFVCLGQVPSSLSDEPYQLKYRNYISAYDDTYTTGKEWKLPITDGDCGCHELPTDAKNAIRSVGMHGNCAIFFYKNDCSVSGLRLEPYSFGYNKLAFLAGDWDKTFQSYASCHCGKEGGAVVTTTGRSID